MAEQRLIDANAFRRELDNHWPFTKEEQEKHGIADMAKTTVVVLLNQMPTIEPERKTGKWVYKNDLKQFFCSECGYPSLTYDDTYIYGMDLPNYCEDCGADMTRK